MGTEGPIGPGRANIAPPPGGRRWACANRAEIGWAGARAWVAPPAMVSLEVERVPARRARRWRSAGCGAVCTGVDSVCAAAVDNRARRASRACSASSAASGASRARPPARRSRPSRCGPVVARPLSPHWPTPSRMAGRSSSVGHRGRPRAAGRERRDRRQPRSWARVIPQRCRSARRLDAVVDRRPAGVRPASAILSRPARIRRADLFLPYEAHLPAQEAQARPDARLPCAHEHARRPHRAEASSRQGPQAAHGLVSDRPTGGRTPKRRRLSRSAEFERVYRQGRSKANRFLVLYAFPREDEEPADRDAADGPRLGLSVSRRVGGAVDRTRVKRVLREAFWAEAERLPPGADYVVVARPDSRELAEREGMPGVRTALAELVDQLPRRKGRRRVSIASRIVLAPVRGVLSASSRRRCRAAASTTRPARRTRCRRWRATAYSAGSSWPSGVCSGATRSATVVMTP